jgi:hypothetical protein
MTVEEKIQALLVASLPAYGSPIAVLVPAARIKAPGNWQAMDLPYVIHFPVSELPFHMHSGLLDLDEWPIYQVSVFAETYSEAKVIAEAIATILNGNSSGVEILYRGMAPIPYEFDTRIQQIVCSFQIFEAL